MEDIYDRNNRKPDAPHRHNFFTVLVVKQGRGQHFIDFNSYVLKSAQVYFLSPGQVHQLIEEDRSIGYSMVFSANFLAQNNIPIAFIDDLHLFENYGSSPPMEVQDHELAKLSNLCEEMITYHTVDSKWKDQAIGALLKLLLIRCNNACTLPFSDTQKLEAGNSILKSFKSLVEENYKEWHSVRMYASQLNISPDHLNRTIKSLIGQSAKEYIQARITTAAKRMIFFSDLSNKQIGFELGFSEPANFSAFFKKCTGESPSSFREKK